jgi:hypothetical protein
MCLILQTNYKARLFIWKRYLYVCIYVCICMYARVIVCMHICIISTYTNTCIHSRYNMYMHKYTRAYACTYREMISHSRPGQHSTGQDCGVSRSWVRDIYTHKAYMHIHAYKYIHIYIHIHRNGIPLTTDRATKCGERTTEFRLLKLRYPGTRKVWNMRIDYVI